MHWRALTRRLRSHGNRACRPQIVIQVAEEVNGIIMVRTGTNDKIVPCPSKYLQEITLWAYNPIRDIETRCYQYIFAIAVI